MSYYDTHLDPYDFPAIEPETYCTVFAIPWDMQREIIAQVKARKLTELYGTALANLEPGRPYAITVDFTAKESRCGMELYPR